MKPHIHSETIKAWADGAKIQFKGRVTGDWLDTLKPDWSWETEYRVKPGSNLEIQKTTMYIYSNIEDGKSFITPNKLHPAHENERYCRYMGNIEVCK